MAKKIQLSYKEIEDNLKVLRDNPVPKEEIGFRLLNAFGKSEVEIRRFKEGKGVIKTFDGLLIKGLFCYKASTTLRFANELDNLKHDTQVLKAAPKIIAVSDGETIRAFDLRQLETFEQKVNRLFCDFEFFYPLAGVERVEYVEESPADIKAAEKLAKLHDEIRAYNEFTSDSDLHDLNTFIARLLFCFFAEDTGIFAPNVFTHAIEQFTHDATNLKDVLEQIFRFMGNKPIPVGMLSTYCQQNFAYVGGGLFERSIYIPELSNKARQIIIESGELDWQNINPDIFGSMIQAVVNPDERATQGMHYTSVPNIMKVINPLFLDELRASYNALAEEYDKLKKQKDINMLTSSQFFNACKPIERKCKQLLLRISKMKFFDPACGSGNFLIITYKMLRLLEMDILALMAKMNPQGTMQFIDGSVISLQQFYGIELLDFPHEVAMLSLWLAEHQMNKKMREDFGVNTNALPLKDINNIRCGNACRLDWNVVCPHGKEEEVFVFGNPPYLGGKLQTKEQKSDHALVLGHLPSYKNLDYISSWFYKGALFIKDTKASYSFVSTNSITQGEQVCMLWPYIYELGVEICFAYKSFKWTNNAKNQAGVSCVIIGLSAISTSKKKLLFETNGTCKTVDKISPYLYAGSQAIVHSTNKSISGFPLMEYGNMPLEGGFLKLSKEEKDELISENSGASQFIRPTMGGEELLNGIARYCLWINDKELKIAESIEGIRKRIEGVYNFRVSGGDVARSLVDRCHQFRYRKEASQDEIVIACTSSENRMYIPTAILDKDYITMNSLEVIYDSPFWILGVISTRLHMIWTKSIGGYLGTSIRYSVQMIYNTFPFPHISQSKKDEIEEAATNILLTREPYLTKGHTLADLYDPDKMPDDLRSAHKTLDDIVESCYPGYPFASDEARLECLFKMYEKLTKANK